MTANEAAIKVLQLEQRALHAKELATKMLEQGLWQTKGKTPDATVSSRLYTSIQIYGDKSPFIKAGPQIFAMNPKYSGQEIITPVAQKIPSEKIRSTRVCGGYSFTEAAFEILNAQTECSPLHYRTITMMALENGLLTTTGKTPERTMYAQILTEINHCQYREKGARFIKLGRGMVALTKWANTGWTHEMGSRSQDFGNSCDRPQGACSTRLHSKDIELFMISAHIMLYEQELSLYFIHDYWEKIKKGFLRKNEIKSILLRSRSQFNCNGGYFSSNNKELFRDYYEYVRAKMKADFSKEQIKDRMVADEKNIDWIDNLELDYRFYQIPPDTKDQKKPGGLIASIFQELS